MDVVERQLKAYNEKDIDAFMDCYAEDIQVFKFPNELMYADKAAMRERYDNLFKTYPNMNAEVTKRIRQNEFVIDHEFITGRTEEPFTATALYEVKDDIILKVWFL